MQWRHLLGWVRIGQFSLISPRILWWDTKTRDWSNCCENNCCVHLVTMFRALQCFRMLCLMFWAPKDVDALWSYTQIKHILFKFLKSSPLLLRLPLIMNKLYNFFLLLVLRFCAISSIIVLFLLTKQLICAFLATTITRRDCLECKNRRNGWELCVFVLSSSVF